MVWFVCVLMLMYVILQPLGAAEAEAGRNEANGINTRVYGKLSDASHTVKVCTVTNDEEGGKKKQTEEREPGIVNPVGLPKVLRLFFFSQQQ